jgi:hypothetical protein
MATIFDLVTVTCFAALVIAFFQFTDRDTRILVRLLPAAIVFAIADQIGNKDGVILAIILISAGIGYAILVIKRYSDY